MQIAARLQRLVSQPSVGMDHAAGFHRLFDKANQTTGRSVWNPPHANPPDPFAVFLSRHHNQRLVLRLPTANTLFQAAQVSFVRFHASRESFPPRSHHGPTQFVKHRPGGLIAAQAQNPLQSQSTDAVLLAGDVPHGPKPDPQGQMTVLKNGPRRDRHLIPALVATPAIPSHRPGLCSGAPWTDPSARPAQNCEKLGAGFLAVEAPFQLEQCPRVILAHSPGHYILG
jgi:hypothetical protein